MTRPVSVVPAHSPNNWRELFEAALLESNPAVLPQRLQDATEAIMDEIEDSLFTASQAERLALLTALQAVRELRRLSQCEDPQASPIAGKSYQAA